MKKECERTRKLLKRYLQGHLFRPDMKRIARHLQSCPLCGSECQALQRAAETRQLLQYVEQPEGMVHRMKAGVTMVSRLQKIFYRPLWLSGILAVAAAVYFYAVTPRQFDLELDSISKSGLTITAQTISALSTSIVSTVTVSTAPQAVAAAPPVPTIEPLAITVIVEDEKAATRKINQVLQGHAVLRKKKFSDASREISGSLNSKELLTLFGRLEAVGKIKFSRSRLESFPSSRSIPFVMKLKTIVRSPERPAVSEEQRVKKPATRPDPGP